jgi:pSer/pThr/pTyr-binding forkhead associated (FHA) protein
MMQKKAVRYPSTNIPVQSNEIARLKIAKGADLGAAYVILNPSVTLGRGEENDVVLSDVKASRVHARLQLVNGRWQLLDQNSANGLKYQGKEVKEIALHPADQFELGATIIEFAPLEMGAQQLMAPARAGNTGIISPQQQQRIDEIRKSGGLGASGIDLPKLLAVGAILMAGAFVFFSQPNIPQKKTKTVEKSTLAQYLPTQDPTTTHSAESIYKDGLREYFDGNYNRARTQFETVLQISPGHVLATLYLENCHNAMKEEVKSHLDNGKRSLSAGKLRDAKAHYERILRLLYRDQSNASFIEATDQLKIVNKRLIGGDD